MAGGGYFCRVTVYKAILLIIESQLHIVTIAT